MNLEELKSILKDKIDKVSDEDTLYLLGNLLESNDEKIYKFSEEQKQKIQISTDQLSKNEIVSNKDVFKKFDEWLI